MKCNHCGHENPKGSKICEECHRPLPVKQKTDSGRDSFGKATVREDDMEGCKKESNNSGSKTILENPTKRGGECPICHYPLENGICPICGYPEEEIKPQPTAYGPRPVYDDDKEQNDRCESKTVRPKRKETMCFTLTPISDETGQPTGDKIPFEGKDVVLNRANTDPQNPTITSKQQAVISNEDGKWFIEDKSSLQTTFVRAAHKIELQKDDLILLGSQLYRFELKPLASVLSTVRE